MMVIDRPESLRGFAEAMAGHTAGEFGALVLLYDQRLIVQLGKDDDGKLEKICVKRFVCISNLDARLPLTFRGDTCKVVLCGAWIIQLWWIVCS